MKRFLIALPIVFLLLAVIFFSQIRLGVITALFLRDVLDEKNLSRPERAALAWIAPTASVKQLQIPVEGRSIGADLYYFADGKKRAAILLTHGIVDAGKDDPRLIRFAHSLTRCGFVVLVPELRGMKSFRILLSDVDDIVASFLQLRSLRSEVDETRMGLVGFSYGAGPTFMAAAAPAIREKIKFLVSFGGYYDPVNVIRFITTGFYEYGKESGFLEPDPYGKWVFFMNNVDYVGDEGDRRLLRTVFENEGKGKKTEAVALLGGLSPKGKNLYDLLVNRDPQRVDALVEGIDPKVLDYLRKLSLGSVVPSLRSYLLIGHGSTDSLIPYTESLRLADAVKDKAKVHVAILQLFSHVDPAAIGFSRWEYFTVYLPSLARFYFLIYDLISQQL